MLIKTQQAIELSLHLYLDLALKSWHRFSLLTIWNVCASLQIGFSPVIICCCFSFRPLLWNIHIFSFCRGIFFCFSLFFWFTYGTTEIDMFEGTKEPWKDLNPRASIKLKPCQCHTGIGLGPSTRSLLFLPLFSSWGLTGLPRPYHWPFFVLFPLLLSVLLAAFVLLLQNWLLSFSWRFLLFHRRLTTLFRTKSWSLRKVQQAFTINCSTVLSPSRDC